MPFLHLFSFPYLDLSITFDLLSGAVAILVCYYSFRYNRLIENSTLKFVSFGFALLGLGLLAEASVLGLVVFGIGSIFSVRLLALGTSSIFDLLQVAAYLLFAVGYVRGVYLSRVSKPDFRSNAGIGSAGTGTVAGMILASSSNLALSPAFQRLRDMILLSRAVFVISEVLSIIFLSLVVLVGTLGYLKTHNRLAIMVLLSFVLILAAQAMDLWSVISVSVILNSISSAIQFGGFLSFLVFILWRGKIGPARKAA